MRQLADSIKDLVNGSPSGIVDGIVDTVNPTAGTVSVTVQPHGAQVEGLPYFTPVSTGPWKWLALPKVGATVKIVASDPTTISADTAYVVGSQWDEDDVPPSGYNTGDILLAHDNGTGKLCLKANGDIEIDGSSSSKVLLKANGDIEIDGGTVTVTSSNVLLGDSGGLAICNQNLKSWADSLVSRINSQMALIVAHTHGIIPDPTLTAVGGFSTPSNALTTKVKAT